jgi:hypothetical protein
MRPNGIAVIVMTRRGNDGATFFKCFSAPVDFNGRTPVRTGVGCQNDMVRMLMGFRFIGHLLSLHSFLKDYHAAHKRVILFLDRNKLLQYDLKGNQLSSQWDNL